jgi:RHS repeat-associated protein
MTYDIAQKGSTMSSITTYGWPGQPVIKTDQINYNYINVNGVFKPQSITSTSTQQGEPAYTRAKEFMYDGLGHLTSTINDPSFGVHSLITNYSIFNAFGSPTKATLSAGDILPRTSETFFDATGRFVTKTINPKGDIEEFVYEPKYGSLIQKKDISGLVSKFYYDGLGRLIKTKLPDNTTNTIQYNWVTPNPYSTFSKTVINEGEAYFITFYNFLGNQSSTETIDFNGNIIVSQNKYNYLTGLLEETSEPHFASAPSTPYLISKFTYDFPFFRVIKTETLKVIGGGSSGLGLFVDNTFNVPSKFYPVSGTSTYNAGFNQSIDQTGKMIGKENNAAGQVTITKNRDASFVTQTSTIQFNSNGSPKNTVLTYSSILDVITHTFVYNNLGQQTQLIDPTAGTINYQYNTIGELLQQSDPNGTHDYTYDNIGRVLTRTGSTSGLTSYQYVTANAGKNLVEKISGLNVTSEFTYDFLSRPITQKETVVSTGKIFTSATDYDTYSRVTKHTHTGGFITKYAYASTGQLIAINDNSNQSLWQLNNQNALGQITDYTYGNGINTTKVYDDLHQLKEINHGTLHKQVYNFAITTGNLLQRDFYNYTTGTHNREKFQYDNLDRLNQSKQTDPTNFDLTLYTNNTAIDIKGNITQKDDAGTFVYSNPSKPFTLTSITSPTSLIPLNTLNTTINDLHKVIQITEPVSGQEMNFIYGNDDERVKMDYLIGGVKQYTRYYQANYDYEEDATISNTKEFTHIYAPTGLLAVYYKQNTTGQLLYALTDHLGSPVMLTDNTQNIHEEYSFDAWGRRRNPIDWSYTAITPSILKRGFTFHEHIDEFNLINMNGRIYDPALGRFIQPDNYIQTPDNLQNFNRYAYCLNNPLKYNDLSGNWFGYDDLAVVAAGFVIGYANYLISSPTYSDWGAVKAGLIGAGTAWLGYNTFGASAVAGNYIASMVGNAIVNNVAGGSFGYSASYKGLNISASASVFSPTGFNPFIGGNLSKDMEFGDVNLNLGVSFGMGSQFSQITKKEVAIFTLGVGAELGYEDASIGFGTNIFKSNDGTSQRIGSVSLSKGGFRLLYQNDYISKSKGLNNLGDNGDRYRTASLRVSYKDYSIGFKLATGDPGRYMKDREFEDVNGHATYKNGNEYRLGALYVGYKNYQIGLNSEGVRHVIQNRFAHDILTKGASKWFQVDKNKPSIYSNSTPFYNWSNW